MNKSFILFIVFLIVITVLIIKGHIIEKENQCHGNEQFYAFAGKVYPCGNYQGK